MKRSRGWREGFSWADASNLAGSLTGYGSVAMSGLMAVIGQFALALVFAAIAAGVFLRLWRARRVRVKR